MKSTDKPIAKAKNLRRNMTDAEQAIWRHLRGKRFVAVKFKRQKPIGPYIVDFVAAHRKLVIEIDGAQHAEERKAYDEERTRFLESRGYRVLRYWNNDCLSATDSVLDDIFRVVREGADGV